MWKKSAPLLIGFCIGAASVAIFFESTAPSLKTSDGEIAPTDAPAPMPVTTSLPSESATNPEFEARLTREVTMAVKAELTDWFAKNAARLTVAQVTADSASTESESEPQPSQLTEDQQGIYDTLRTRLRDATLNRGLTWSQLAESQEVKQLPKEWREKLFAEVVGMLNNGELNASSFLEQPQQ